MVTPFRLSNSCAFIIFKAWTDMTEARPSPAPSTGIISTKKMVSLKDHDSQIIVGRRYNFAMDAIFTNVDCEPDDDEMEEDDNVSVSIKFAYNMHVHHAADIPSTYDFLLDQWILRHYARNYQLKMSIGSIHVVTFYWSAVNDTIGRIHPNGVCGRCFRSDALRRKIEKYISTFSKNSLGTNLQKAIDEKAAEIKDLFLSLTFLEPRNLQN